MSSNDELRMTTEQYTQWLKENEDFLQSKREDEEEVLAGPSELPPFWNPTEKGQTLEARLVSIHDTRFNPVLRVRERGTGELYGVPVRLALAEVDWPKHLNALIRFTYFGQLLTGKEDREMKIIRASRIKEDDVPF